MWSTPVSLRLKLKKGRERGERKGGRRMIELVDMTRNLGIGVFGQRETESIVVEDG